MLKTVFHISIIFFFLSCSSSGEKIAAIKLTNLQGQEFYLSNIHPPKVVLFFLSPECPLCENYAQTLNQLYHTYRNDFSFCTIFPGKFYTREKIKLFKEKYKLELPVLLDTELELTKAIKASVTPEVFVLDTLSRILYHGAIDNRAISLGKKRTQITKHYLSKALKAITHNQDPETAYVKPVGCYIEYE